jgi:hypothetical protein
MAATYEGHVENGQIKLDEDVKLPERAKVFVVLPEIKGERIYRIMSPKLIREEGAPPLRMEVTKEEVRG